MNASEKSVLIKILETFTTEEKIEAPAEAYSPIYEKDVKTYIDKLEKRKQSFSTKQKLEEGNIIVWKEGMKNKRLPEYNQPSIIIKKINPPISNQEGSFDEELDISIGFITDEEEFLVYTYDSSRFKLFQI